MNQFDAVAGVYDALKRLVFGRTLQDAQHLWLPTIPAGASVLILGGGTGEVLEAVLQTGQPAAVLYVEASAKMLHLTTRRLLNSRCTGTVTYRLGTEQSLAETQTFDVLITPFVLDLYAGETLRRHIVPRLANALNPNGCWLITDFVPTKPLAHRLLAASMITFFRLTARIETRTLPDWPALLDEFGLRCTHRTTRIGGMVVSEVRRKIG